MPSRIIREGILDSDAINSVSEGAEFLYRRLMNVVDDYGRFDGRVELLRVRLFPLRLDSWPLERVESCLAELAETKNAAGDPLVLRYEAQGKPYVEMSNFGQQIRSKAKFPSPENGVITPVIKPPADAHATRARARSESESYSKSETETKTESAPDGARDGLSRDLPDDAYEQIERAYPKPHGKGPRSRAAWQTAMDGHGWQSKFWDRMLAAAKAAARLPRDKVQFLPGFDKWLVERQYLEDWDARVRFETGAPRAREPASAADLAAKMREKLEARKA